MSERGARLCFGPFILDVGNLVLMHDGLPLKIGPKVVQTLAVLTAARGAVVTKNDLVEALWPEGFVEEGNLTQTIYVLRKTLREHWDWPAIITLPRRGYRFNANVTLDEVAAPRRLKRAWSGFLAIMAVCGVAMLTSADMRNIAVRPEVNSHVHRLYVLGRYYWNLRTQTGLTTSLGYFSRVAKLEPRSPLGYAGLADAYLMLIDHGFGGRNVMRRYAELARVNSRRSLMADPNSAEALTSAGMVALSFDHDTSRADGDFKAAIASGPDYACAHHWYGTSLAMQGRLAAAHRQFEIAATLDPTSSSITSWLAADYYFLRNYRAAISYNRQALELDPQRTDVLYTLGLAYEQSKNYPQAIAVFRKLQRASHGALVGQTLLAHTYATMGDVARARRTIASVRRRSGSDDFSAVEFAMALIAVRQRNDALHWLRTARDLPPRMKMWLALDPRMDAVRGDVRFRTWTS